MMSFLTVCCCNQSACLWTQLDADMRVLYVQCLCTLRQHSTCRFLQLAVRNTHSCGLMARIMEQLQWCCSGRMWSSPSLFTSSVAFFFLLCKAVHAASIHSIKSESLPANRFAGSRIGWRAEALQQPGIFCSVQLCASWHCCHRGMSLFPLRVSLVCMNFHRGTEKSQFTPTLHISSHISAASVIFFITTSPVVMMSLQLFFLPKCWPPLLQSHHHPPLLPLTPTEGYLCSVIGSFSHFSVWCWRQETQQKGEAGLWEADFKADTKGCTEEVRFCAHVCHERTHVI